MGGSISTPEKLYRAVRSNNVVELQDLLHQLHRQGQLDPSTRRRYLEHKDAEGRTPLLLAAGKSAYHIVGMLLANGADITYMRKFNTGGTALHEAACQNHEAVVELLLSHGAEAFGHPFLENYAGRTPIDLAVTEGHVNIVRRLEKCGLFCGYVAVKVPNAIPFGKSWKPRWCVVMKRFSGPSTTTRTEDLVLWYYKDTASCAPLCKVSLAGSDVEVNDNGPPWEATLKLRPNHAKPIDAAVKKEGQRWCLQFRPISNPGDTAPARSAPHAPNVIPEDAFFNLVRACNALRQPPEPRTPRIPHPSPQPAQAIHSPSNPFSPVGPPAGYPAPTIPPPPPQTQAAAAARPAGHVDRLEAMPGETDAQFALRLANIIRPPESPASPSRPEPRTSSSPSPSPPPASSTLHPAPHSVASQVPVPPARPTNQPSEASRLQEPPPASPPGNAAPAMDPGQMLTSLFNSAMNTMLPAVLNTIGNALGGGSNGGNPPSGSQVPAAASPIPPPPSTNPASSPPSAPIYSFPSMPMTQNRPDTRPSSNLPRYPSLSRIDSAIPSAPILPSASSLPIPAQSSGSGSLSNEDDGLCVICLSNSRESGFLHGSTVHRCVCNECAGHIKPGDACPMCRQPVERVIGVF